VREVGELLRPYPSEVIRAYRVRTAVNSVRDDGPERIEPVVSGRKRSPAAGKENRRSDADKGFRRIQPTVIPLGNKSYRPDNPLIVHQECEMQGHDQTRRQRSLDRKNGGPREKILVLAAIGLSLYSMGPVMANSMLSEPKAPQQRHQTLAPQVPRRYQPIRNSHNLQPTRNKLAKPDVSAADGKVVDNLYRELMQEEMVRYPALFRHPTTKPAAMPLSSSK